MCAQIGWDESSPADNESAGLGDDRIRSLKTSLRQGLAEEHAWPSGGGESGQHLRGSAKNYSGLQSQVSSCGTDGKLMWASDTSRLFGVGSGGTAFLGGPNVVSLPLEYIAWPQRFHWVEEMGLEYMSGTSLTVTYLRSGFSGIPYIFLTPANAVVGESGGAGVMFAANVTPTGFIAAMYNPIAGNYYSAKTFYWRSLGTRSL